MKQRLVLLFALLIGITVSAYEFSAVNADGVTLYYNKISGTENEVEVTYNSDSRYSGDVDIPATVTYLNVTYTITRIGAYAFDSCNDLISVNIPNTVTSIIGRAFYMCEYLKTLTIPESVTYIGTEAFMGLYRLKAFYGKYATSDNRCLITEDGILISFAPDGIARYDIPNTAKKIAKYAFWGCNRLTSITIPSSVTEIGERAFDQCM